MCRGCSRACSSGGFLALRKTENSTKLRKNENTKKTGQPFGLAKLKTKKHGQKLTSVAVFCLCED
jgi:hypothetical protein